MWMAQREAEGTPGPSDEALFLSYKEGDEAAFDLLFERYRGPMTSYAWRMVRRREEAEEVCLEAFCRVLEGAWRPGGSLRSFLFTVVHRLCIDRLRKRRRLLPLFPWTPRPAASSVAPDQALEADQRTRKVEAALGRLPEKHRAVLLLYYRQELSSREVAEVLGCEDQQVRSRLSYARKLLRAQLDEEVWP